MQNYNIFKRIKKFCLDTIFPIECLNCGQEDVWICQECLDNIPIKENQICPLCKRPSLFGQKCPYCQKYSFLDGLLIASDYKNDLLQKTIQAFKYQYITKLSQPLGFLLIKFIKMVQNELDKQEYFLRKKHIFLENDFLIIPIPLHKRRERERGFNQSELLAKEIGDYFNWTMEKNTLKRKKYRQAQTQLSGKERKENIRDVFVCSNPEKIEKKNIILIDDVMTTGATLQEAAKVLKNNKVQKVWGLVLAHG